MPRPKVHPSQRQRAAEACNFCRASKKRCSATVPCTACQRRGIGASCFLTHQPRGWKKKPPPRSRASAPEPTRSSPDGGDHNPDAESPWGQDGFANIVPPDWGPATDSAAMSNDADGEYHPPTPSDSRMSFPDETISRSAQETPQLPANSGSPAQGPESHARMLLNLRGEQGKLPASWFVRPVFI